MRKTLILVAVFLFILNLAAVGLAAESTATANTGIAMTAPASGSDSATTLPSSSGSTALGATSSGGTDNKGLPEQEKNKELKEQKIQLRLRDMEDEDENQGGSDSGLIQGTERFQKAKEGLDRALKILAENPSNIKAKEAVLRAHLRVEAMLGDGVNWAAALKLAQAILAEDPTNEIATLVQAKELYDQGKVDEALKLLQDLVAKNPKGMEEAREKIGELLEAKGDLDGAEKALGESLQQNLRNKKVYEKLGRILEKKGEKGLKVFVDGKRPDFDVKPQIIDGRTMVPFRKVGEALGAKVDWREDTQTVVAERNGVKVEIPIGSLTIYINGKPQAIDVPAQIIGDRTLVPVRFLSQALGASVDWDPTYQIVIVVNEQATPSAAGTAQ